MSLTQRFDDYQQGHTPLGFFLAVVYKFFDDNGPYLAALLTYYAFVSLFPLLLLGTTILGLVLSGHADLQHQILNSALRDVPVVGKQLDAPNGLSGGTGGLVVGVIGALYGGLGVGQASQYVMNTAWAVPRNERPNPFRSRVRSLLLLSTAGLGVLATFALSAVSTSGPARLGTLLRVLALLAAIALNAAVLIMVFRVATARDLTIRDVLPGALLAALGWELLQSFGATYVQHVVRHASDTNGVFALVLGLLAFLFLSANLVVLCVQVNVVWTRRLYPRALLTPFTDNVSLTEGDRLTYTRHAKSERRKGFEQVEVSFDERGQPAGDEQPAGERPQT